jgi:hypothetical protein
MSVYHCPKCGRGAAAPIGFRYAVCEDSRGRGCGYLLKLEPVFSGPQAGWSVDDVMLVKPPRRGDETREKYVERTTGLMLDGLGKIVENWKQRGIICRIVVDKERGKFGIQMKDGPLRVYDEAKEQARKAMIGGVP